MKTNMFLIVLCLMSAVMLSGCVTEGSGSGDSWSGFSTGSSGSDYSESSSTGASAHHNPEPATMAMIGTGLFAYGILNKKRKK